MMTFMAAPPDTRKSRTVRAQLCGSYRFYSLLEGICLADRCPAENCPAGTLRVGMQARKRPVLDPLGGEGEGHEGDPVQESKGEP